MSLPLRPLLLLAALGACWACAPRTWAVHGPPARGAGSRGGVEVAGLRPVEDRREDADDRAAAEVRDRIVEGALRRLGQRFDGDCSTFVRRVLREAEVELGPLPSARTMSESLHLVARPVERPAAGDLVFFHQTFDRNRNGQNDDRWTHVAVVEAVDGDRVSILHRGGKGIIRLRMNLTRPADEAENDPIRHRRPGDPPGTRYLTGQLFAEFGAVVD